MAKSKIQQARKAAIRKKFIEQGGTDGRFTTKVIPNKKKVVAKPKHKKQTEE